MSAFPGGLLLFWIFAEDWTLFVVLEKVISPLRFAAPLLRASLGPLTSTSAFSDALHRDSYFPPSVRLAGRQEPMPLKPVPTRATTILKGRGSFRNLLIWNTWQVRGGLGLATAGFPSRLFLDWLLKGRISHGRRHRPLRSG